MGSVGDMLFGSSEDATITPTSTLTGNQEQLLDQLSKLLQGQVGEGVESYPGDMTAGLTGLETQSSDALSNLLSTLTSQGAVDQNTIDAISRVMGGSTGIDTSDVPGAVSVSGYDVGEFDTGSIQDWYQDALVTPALSTWESDVVPLIQENYIANNAGSSGAINRAITGSAEELMTGLNSQLADKLFSEKGLYDERVFEAGMDTTNKEFTAGSDYADRLMESLGINASVEQNDLDRLLQVPGVETDFINNLLNTASAVGTAGATERGIDQSELDDLISKWSTEQGYNNPWLNLLPSVLGTDSVENIVDQGTQTSGLVQDVAVPLLSAYWKSSQRHKKNIVPIGNKIKGLQPVEFEYTDQARKESPEMTAPGRQVGFLAEEVAEKFPEAVIYDSEGRPDAINYGTLFNVIGA